MWNKLLYLIAFLIVGATIFILFQAREERVLTGPVTIGTGSVDGIY